MRKERENLEEEITSSCCPRFEIKQMSGPNGFPAEFFKKYIDLLGPHILNLSMEAHEKETLPPISAEPLLQSCIKRGGQDINVDLIDPSPFLMLKLKYWLRCWPLSCFR